MIIRLVSFVPVSKITKKSSQNVSLKKNFLSFSHKYLHSLSMNYRLWLHVRMNKKKIFFGVSYLFLLNLIQFNLIMCLEEFLFGVWFSGFGEQITENFDEIWYFLEDFRPLLEIFNDFERNLSTLMSALSFKFQFQFLFIFLLWIHYYIWNWKLNHWT